MYEQYYNEFMKEFQYLSEKHNKFTVFLDFLKLTSISIHNLIFFNQELENQYLKIASNYKKNEIEIFVKMFAKLVLIYISKEEISDVLGNIYMKEKLKNGRLGQVFTPFHIAEFMGKTACGTKQEMQNIIKKNGYITVCDPCTGAGGLILGFVKAVKEYDINYQQDLLVYASDIDEICVYMTYIQLSLYEIPAIVSCENTISMEKNFSLETPAYLMNYKKFEKFGNTEEHKNNGIIEKENIIKFNEVTKNGMCQMSFFLVRKEIYLWK